MLSSGSNQTTHMPTLFGFRAVYSWTAAHTLGQNLTRPWLCRKHCCRGAGCLTAPQSIVSGLQSLIRLSRWWTSPYKVRFTKASLPGRDCCSDTWTAFTGFYNFLCLIRQQVLTPGILNRQNMCISHASFICIEGQVCLSPGLELSRCTGSCMSSSTLAVQT